MADTTSPVEIFSPSIAGALRQGEIITDLVQYRRLNDRAEVGQAPFESHHYSFAVVVSQDCDLDWDFKARQSNPPKASKLLTSILFCEAKPAADVRFSGISKEMWDKIRQNKDERYQFLQCVPTDRDAFGEGVGELVLDFKRYFGLLAVDAYEQVAGDARRRCCLVSPYLQHLATRFYYFQYRVALPKDHESEPGSTCLV